MKKSYYDGSRLQKGIDSVNEAKNFGFQQVKINSWGFLMILIEKLKSNLKTLKKLDSILFIKPKWCVSVSNDLTMWILYNF